MDSDSSTPQGASATEAFSLTPATPSQSSKMQVNVSKVEEDEEDMGPLGTLTLASLTLEELVSQASKLTNEQARKLVRGFSHSLNLTGSKEYLSLRNKSAALASQPDDDNSSTATCDSMPELASQSDDEPDDDNKSAASCDAMGLASQPDDDNSSTATCDSMPGLASQSDDEPDDEPDDDDNEDQAKTAKDVLARQIDGVIKGMGYVPSGDLNL